MYFLRYKNAKQIKKKINIGNVISLFSGLEISWKLRQYKLNISILERFGSKKINKFVICFI